MNKSDEMKLSYTIEILNESIVKHNEIKSLITNYLDYLKKTNEFIDTPPLIHRWDEPFSEIEEMLQDIKLVMKKVCEKLL